MLQTISSDSACSTAWPRPEAEPGIDGSGGSGVRHKRRELDHKKGSNPVNLRLKYRHLTKYRHISKTVPAISPLGV